MCVKVIAADDPELEQLIPEKGAGCQFMSSTISNALKVSQCIRFPPLSENRKTEEFINVLANLLLSFYKAEPRDNQQSLIYLSCAGAQIGPNDRGVSKDHGVLDVLLKTELTSSGYEPEKSTVDMFESNQEGVDGCQRGLQHSTADFVEEESSFNHIKSEIKCEQPELTLHDEDSQQEPVKKKPCPTMKCPGCSAVYSDNRSGLDALGHHIINSHRRYAVHYRRRLRARLLAER